MAEPVGKHKDVGGFAPKCLSIDLEVGKEDKRIHQFAAVRGDNGQAFGFDKGDLSVALDKLDYFADGLKFLLGHNLIAFDTQYLAAVKPDLQLLGLPKVDTLRLNPLAHPRNPYHRLVKHYQDGQLKCERRNDPELDARLTLEVFGEQHDALRACDASSPDLVLAWHWLTTVDDTISGLNSFFTKLRDKPRPNDMEARAAIERLLKDKVCLPQGRNVIADANRQGWALAYALAWLSVSGENSVMPPWVRHQFPEAGELVKQLRDCACDDPACTWCRERHDACRELKHWFGFDAFRAEPADANGRPLQQSIVEAAMRGEHVLGILPTGTGKSLCYQIPALSRYYKTGALTVVISPLVALMADQVEGLKARHIYSCAAINGLLSMPERADVLDRVRLGDIGILLIAPEQLRNRTVQRVLAQREIGAWVLDEAHCLSKWGHAFRPDYRYVGKFIKNKYGDGFVPPVLCLTATAKPDVVREILEFFRDTVGVEVKLFDGGTSRENLVFDVIPTTLAGKLEHIHQVLMHNLPPEMSGGAIVYCATRRQTEEVADFLRKKGVSAAHFHSTLKPETKKDVQERFIRGDLRVIAATNAFGMGIDKPDVRLVIHADIPGSLENYLQEAGRAGRDRLAAHCVLLYTQDDVERQFGMSAASRLSRREIQSILKSLRMLDRKKRYQGEVVATPGEILAEDTEGVFERDSATDDTRVRTAVAWLEEARLLKREENRVQVFPSSLRIATLEEARARLEKRVADAGYRQQLFKLVETLMSADADEGISTDELIAVSGLNSEQISHALYELERIGVASNDMALTAFVHAGVEQSSRKRFEQNATLEQALIDALRELAPDMQLGETYPLYLRQTTQHLKDAGYTHALPEKLAHILAALAGDGRNENAGLGSFKLRRTHDAEVIQVTLQREWQELEDKAHLRRVAAERLLEHFLASLPSGARGTDLLAETTMGKLLAAIENDLELGSAVGIVPTKLLDRALLWMHDLDILRLNKGLAVFRPAMTITLEGDRRNFAQADFTPLKMHYDEQVIQIHVMAEYVERGLKAMAEALRLAMDYFQMDSESFLKRWLPGREKELSRQTTPQSWDAIVRKLDNPWQQRVVADDREQSNVLVLAGPGSGKTRVLVHRIAYLVRVRRENPHSIIALTYNRHAAVEIRRRLFDLIGNDARGIMVMTCHALAMRLVGASFSGRVDDDTLDAVMRDAVALLKGDGLPPEEADEQRDRLLTGFRWILVDEYQDIGPVQYELISALVGRTQAGEDGKLSLFAVGDDDQNIYAFNGASVEFIRRFKEDYAARPEFLTENYRSTRHIIEASNALIKPAAHRMKAERPIAVNHARDKQLPGGVWQAWDNVGHGRVQILSAGDDYMCQAIAVMAELERLAALDSDWNWARVAVIAREWKVLDPLRAYCETHDIPAQMASEDGIPFWRLREAQALVAWAREQTLITARIIEQWLAQQPTGRWWTLLDEAVEAYGIETGGAELPGKHFSDWLAEWVRDIRRKQTGLLLLTAHRAKGLEFDHVAVLDGVWDKRGHNEDADAARRLYYVAMTRARETLTLTRFSGRHPLLDALANLPDIAHRTAAMLPPPSSVLARRYQRLTMKEIDIGFVGRHAADDPIHKAIAALTAGDALKLEQRGGRWCLFDGYGRKVGHLSKDYTPLTDKCVEARVMAVVTRRQEDEKPEYRNRTRCDCWEIVLPELVFE